MRLTMYEYIATKKPKDAFMFVKKYGDYPRPLNEMELAQFIKEVVNRTGETALKELASIHPDRELIESIQTKSFANASGCGCQSFTTFDGTTYMDASGCGMHNADGTPIITSSEGKEPQEPSKEKGDNIDKIILAMVFLSTLYVLTQNK